MCLDKLSVNKKTSCTRREEVCSSAVVGGKGTYLSSIIIIQDSECSSQKLKPSIPKKQTPNYVQLGSGPCFFFMISLQGFGFAIIVVVVVVTFIRRCKIHVDTNILRTTGQKLSF